MNDKKRIDVVGEELLVMLRELNEKQGAFLLALSNCAECVNSGCTEEQFTDLWYKMIVAFDDYKSYGSHVDARMHGEVTGSEKFINELLNKEE